MTTREARYAKLHAQGLYPCSGCSTTHRRVTKGIGDYTDRGFLPVTDKPTTDSPCGSYVVNSYSLYYVGYTAHGMKFVAAASSHDGFPL